MGAWQTTKWAWHLLLVGVVLMVGPALSASRIRRNEVECEALTVSSEDCFNKAVEDFTETMKDERDPDTDTCTNKVCDYLEALNECSNKLLPCEGEEKVQQIKDEKLQEVLSNRDCKKWNLELCSTMKQYMDRHPHVVDDSIDYTEMMDEQTEEEKEPNGDEENEVDEYLAGVDEIGERDNANPEGSNEDEAGDDSESGDNGAGGEGRDTVPEVGSGDEGGVDGAGDDEISTKSEGDNGEKVSDDGAGGDGRDDEPEGGKETTGAAPEVAAIEGDSDAGDEDGNDSKDNNDSDGDKKDESDDGDENDSKENNDSNEDKTDESEDGATNVQDEEGNGSKDNDDSDGEKKDENDDGDGNNSKENDDSNGDKKDKSDDGDGNDSKDNDNGEKDKDDNNGNGKDTIILSTTLLFATVINFLR